MEKEKKPIYKKWWFWVIIFCTLFVVVASSEDDTTKDSSITANSNSTIKTNSEPIKATVTLINFSEMGKEDIQNWCKNNNLSCYITYEYSDEIEKDKFISQSVKENDTAYEGDKITIVYSLGRKPTNEEKNALKKAESYSSMMHMSKNKIYKQLTSEYGESFSSEAAQYAIDNLKADWNKNALEKAKSYQTTMNMSKQKIYQQLISEYGEDFTKEQAQYAIDHLDD